MKIGIVVDNELNHDIRVLREIGILKEQGFEIFVLCFGFFKTYKDPVNQIQVTRINIPGKFKDIFANHYHADSCDRIILFVCTHRCLFLKRPSSFCSSIL